jgi:hypothetical protein
MKNIVLAGVAVVALAATSVVYAQRQDHDIDRASWWQRMHMSPEDRLAFVDARIAAVKAGLKLTPDQEKNWPAIESAVRDFAKQRVENANASTNTGSDQPQEDPVTRLRQRADRMAAAAAGLKRIADAADPLYKSLDDGQKRRLSFLVHMGGEHRFEAWRERFGFSHRDGDRDSDRDGHHDRGMGRGHMMDDDSGRL